MKTIKICNKQVPTLNILMRNQPPQWIFLVLLLSSHLLVACSSVPGNYFQPREKESEIRAQIQDLSGKEGFVMLAIHFRKENYERSEMPLIAAKKRVTGSTMQFRFTGDFSPGEYGAVAFHDEDGNGELRTNQYGIPLEGFGFSRNPKLAGGKPKWEALVFSVQEPIHEETIRMMYATKGVSP